MRIFFGLFVSATIGLLSACSSTPSIESDLGIRGAPDWVNEGTQAVNNAKGRFIYGVGVAPPMNNQSLQTATADTRARAEVARMITSYIDHTLTDYATSSSDSNLSSVEQQLNSSTQTLLHGSSIQGRWKDKKTGNIYAFAAMDMKTLDAAIDNADKLSQNFQRFYETNANANFDRFMKDALQ